MLRINDYLCLTLNITYPAFYMFIRPFSLWQGTRGKECRGRGVWRNVKVRRLRGCCGMLFAEYVVTGALITCTRSKKVQAHYNYSMDGSEAHKTPLLSETWLTEDSCWSRRNYSFLGFWPQIGFSCCSGWPYVHLHMNSTNWTCWVMEEEEKKKSKGVLGEVGATGC